MQMTIDAHVCGPCLVKGIETIAIRQYTVDISGGWVGDVEEDARTEGVISVCAEHRKSYEELLSTLAAITDESLIHAEVSSPDGDDQDQDDPDEADQDQDQDDDPEDGHPGTAGAVADLPQQSVPCPECGAEAGEPCRSHGGTRVRSHDVHQKRTAAWNAAQAPRGESPKRTIVMDKRYTAALRTWARSQGYDVGNKGRISANIHQAFAAAGYPGLD